MSDLVSRIARAAAEKAQPLPKAELHVHVEGTASPALAREQARRYGVDLSAILDGARYRWQGFTGFLHAYDLVAGLFRDEADYARLAEDYLSGIAAQGALYAELFVSPDHARRAGMEAKTYIAALSAGAAKAEREHGIVCRLIVVGIRHLGPESVEAAARFAATSAHPDVTGFGLAGDERRFRPADFTKAFDIAREAGLGLTAHAGEFAGPESVSETLDALKVSRIGHGVRAIEDAALVKRLAAEGIVLETCPGSNLALGVFPDASAHPLRRFHEAGVVVTVNSDDPPFFGTDLAAQYAFAEDAGFGEAERLALTRNAIEAGFLDGATRGRLLERLAARAIALGAPGVSE